MITAQEIVRLLPPRTTTYTVRHAQSARRYSGWLDAPPPVRRADHIAPVPPELGARLIAGLQALGDLRLENRP